MRHTVNAENEIRWRVRNVNFWGLIKFLDLKKYSKWSYCRIKYIRNNNNNNQIWQILPQLNHTRKFFEFWRTKDPSLFIINIWWYTSIHVVNFLVFLRKLSFSFAITSKTDLTLCLCARWFITLHKKKTKTYQVDGWVNGLYFLYFIFHSIFSLQRWQRPSRDSPLIFFIVCDLSWRSFLKALVFWYFCFLVRETFPRCELIPYFLFNTEILV